MKGTQPVSPLVSTETDAGSLQQNFSGFLGSLTAGGLLKCLFSFRPVKLPGDARAASSRATLRVARCLIFADECCVLCAHQSPGYNQLLAVYAISHALENRQFQNLCKGSEQNNSHHTDF